MPDGRAKTSAENGKKGGRPKLYATKLAEALVEEAEAYAKPLATTLRKKALEGDLPSIKEMLDRGVGKALQNVDVTTMGKELPTPIMGYDAVQTDNSDQEDSETPEQA